MIQTNTFVSHLRGVKRDIEPKDMINPSGRDITRVKTKIRQVVLNPSRRLNVTRINMIYSSSLQV